MWMLRIYNVCERSRSNVSHKYHIWSGRRVSAVCGEMGKMKSEGIKQKEAVIQNLEDAGCSGDSIEEYLTLAGKGAVKAQLVLLEKHRKDLLDAVHENEKKIDCLDYLIYQIRSSKEMK